MCLRGDRSKLPKYDVFMCLKTDLIFANSTDSDEMLPYVAFHLGLHCLPKYLFTELVARLKRVKHSIKMKSYQELLFEQRSMDTLV